MNTTAGAGKSAAADQSKGAIPRSGDLCGPGHTRGLQVVVVETDGRPVVVGGDVAVWFGELDEPHTEGQLRVRALDPELVWLAHEHEPWRPQTV
jgi:hypothetical protein